MKKIILAIVILALSVVFTMGSAEAIGPYYLQLNEWPDCYVVTIDQPAGNAYGSIGFYGALTSGLYKAATLGLGWSTDGVAQFLTIFNLDGTESLYSTDGTTLTLVGTATWTMVASCNSLADNGNGQAD